MNWIDVLLIVIVLLPVWLGYRNGFVLSAIHLSEWFGSLLLAFLFYPYMVLLFEKWLPAFNVWKLPLAFLLTFFLLLAIISLIMKWFGQKLPARFHHSSWNKALGIVPGFISGLVYASVVALLLLSAALWDGLMKNARRSMLTEDFARPAQWLEEKLHPVFDTAISHTMTRLTIKPASGESVSLPYRNIQGTARPDLEKKMLEMVNDEREEEGLQPLQADAELSDVARDHSGDMFMRGYFSHYTPEGLSPFDRMKYAAVVFRVAGENLALAPTLSIAHEGLMNSPGHRANILNRSYGRLGIGIIDGGKYGLMISQEFRN